MTLSISLDFDLTDDTPYSALLAKTSVSSTWARITIDYPEATTRIMSPISTRIQRFRTVTPVWIHQWIQNDAQSLT